MDSKCFRLMVAEITCAAVDAGIQEAMGDAKASALRKYQDLVVGSRHGFCAEVHHKPESSQLVCGNRPAGSGG